jgi:hypothetical protein
MQFGRRDETVYVPAQAIRQADWIKNDINIDRRIQVENVGMRVTDESTFRFNKQREIS